MGQGTPTATASFPARAQGMRKGCRTELPGGRELPVARCAQAKLPGPAPPGSHTLPLPGPRARPGSLVETGGRGPI